MTSLLFMDLGAADRKKMQNGLRPLFETMMCDGASSVGAESCTLWIVDSDGEHLWSKVRQGPRGTNLSNDESEVRINVRAFPLRHEVVRLAAEGRPAILNCEDAQADPRFNSTARGMEIYSGRTTRSLLVAPVMGDGGTVLGIVEFVNKLPLISNGYRTTFSEDDERVIRCSTTTLPRGSSRLTAEFTPI